MTRRSTGPADQFAIGFVVAGYDKDGVGFVKNLAIPGPVINDEFCAATVALSYL